MHPPARAGVNFRTVFAGRVRFGGVFRHSLRAMTKKRLSTFLVRKSSPPRQNSGYAYVYSTANNRQRALCVQIVRLSFRCLSIIYLSVNVYSA